MLVGQKKKKLTKPRVPSPFCYPRIIVTPIECLGVILEPKDSPCALDPDAPYIFNWAKNAQSLKMIDDLPTISRCRATPR